MPLLPSRAPRTPAALAFLGAVLLLPGAGWAAEPEKRSLTVLVDGKPYGHCHMTIQQQDGATVVVTESDVEVRILFRKYRYTFRCQEVWQGGTLQRLESNCDDNGKAYRLSAARDSNGLRLTINGKQAQARPDVWVTTYWSRPPDDRINKDIPLLDADTGDLMWARLQLLGVEQRGVAGQVQNLTHYRLIGDKVRMSLWYDARGYLARQEWVELGHRTTLELSGVER